MNLAAPGKPVGGTYGDLGLGDRDAQFTYAMFRDLEASRPGSRVSRHTRDFVSNLSFASRRVRPRRHARVGQLLRRAERAAGAGAARSRPSDEPQVGESAVVVLGYDYWQRRFGGDPNVIGELLTVNGHGRSRSSASHPRASRDDPRRACRRVRAAVDARAMVPTLGRVRPEQPVSVFSYWIYLFGRLEPGVTLERRAAD